MSIQCVMSKEPVAQFKLNLPVSLKERLEHAAIDNKRSLSAEIIARLSITFLDHDLSTATPQFDSLLQLVANIAAEKASLRTIERLYDYQSLSPEEQHRYILEARSEKEREGTEAQSTPSGPEEPKKRRGIPLNIKRQLDVDDGEK